MRYLLDTHTLIWFINGDTKLPSEARTLIEETDGEIIVSIISFWEIAIKVSLEKLELTQPFSETLTKVEENGFKILPN